MFKPTRVRYKRNGNVLTSQTFLNNELNNIQVEINLDTGSVNLVNDQNELLFGIVSSNYKSNTLKRIAKQLLVDAGVSFFEEARIRKSKSEDVAK